MANGNVVAISEETDLVYFAPEFTETSTIKRVRQFIDSGWRPLVLGFQRGRYNCAYIPEWPHVLLGRTKDKRYIMRLWALLAALPALFGIRARLKTARLFYARNIDQLLLALVAQALFNPEAAVVYEILDIRPIFIGRGLVPRFLRAVEKRCLARVDLLVVSSPAFHRNYYEPVQGYRGPWFVLENKLHHALSPGPRPAGKDVGQRPWRIGYFGLIRGHATLDLIARVAARLRGKVEFVFHGVLTTIDSERFAAALKRNGNIRYDGEYENPRDLAAMYAGVDFAWALDLEHVDSNSRWLLPCRYYESGLFGVPCLAKKGFEIGDLIERLGVGFAVGDPLEDQIVRFFETLTLEDFARKREALMSLPRSAFVAGFDVRKLSNLMQECLKLRMLSPKRTAATRLADAAAREPSGVSRRA